MLSICNNCFPLLTSQGVPSLATSFAIQVGSRQSHNHVRVSSHHEFAWSIGRRFFKSSSPPQTLCLGEFTLLVWPVCWQGDAHLLPALGCCCCGIWARGWINGIIYGTRPACANYYCIMYIWNWQVVTCCYIYWNIICHCCCSGVMFSKDSYWAWLVRGIIGIIGIIWNPAGICGKKPVGSYYFWTVGG